MQQLIMEAKSESFKINQKYHDAIPRPIRDEFRAMDESIRVRGQLYPIAVNKDLVILDGHTRFEILSQRGMMIKYQIFEFLTEEDEFRFVVESNIMKRNLNQFQRIEAMYNFIKAEQEKKIITNYDNLIDAINAIKCGYITAHEIGNEIGMHPQSANRLLKSMIDDFYLRRNKKKNNEKKTYYEYEILPKAEELLAQNARKNKVTISRLIGVSNSTLHYGVYIIEHANHEMLEQLRSGTLMIAPAYTKLIESNIVKNKVRYGKKTLLKCPHCDHISPRSEYKKIDSKIPLQYSTDKFIYGLTLE